MAPSTTEGARTSSGPRPPILVAVAAASETVRARLEALLASSEGLRVVSADRGGLPRQSKTSRPACDVLVVAEVPGLTEGAGSGDFGPAYGGVPAVVCLSEDPDAAARLAASGPPAWALLGPGAGREQLAAAVRAVHRGLVVLGPPLAPGWFPSPAAGGTRGGPAQGPAGDRPRLTPREREVLALLAQGLGNKQIAWELSVSEHTVKYHVSSLYAKLGAGSRTEALRLGIERGLLSL
jgi:DNA-binding NarL/FixJ family response regulator